VHEAALARAILAAALDRAAREGARRLVVVRGWVAHSEALSPSSLEFHFAALARGTLAEGARLELRLARASARCDSCGATYAMDRHVLMCPGCGSADGQPLGPSGLGIESIDVEG
jgi:hydrogenase nickel incorporation protein HypA/HybF